MFQEFANVLLLMLNLFETPMIEPKPQSLLSLASKKAAPLIRKNPDLINQIPENLYHRFGFIQIPVNQPQSEVKLLDIKTKEHFTRKTFERLIGEKRKKFYPFVLAIVYAKNEDKEIYNFYDAIQLTNKLFNENYESNIEKFNDPISDLPIKNVNYFVIVNNFQPEAVYLANNCDLLTNNPKRKLLTIFFQMLKTENSELYDAFYKAMIKLGLKKEKATAYVLAGKMFNESGQINEALEFYKLALRIDIYKREELISLMRDQAIEWENQNKLDFAKQLYLYPANNGDVIAQRNLAAIYSTEGKSDNEILYLEMAAEQNDAYSQNTLGRIYSKNNNPEKAIKYYIAAANQNHFKALMNLGWIYLKNNDNEKSKECFNKASEVAIEKNSKKKFVWAQIGLLHLEQPNPNGKQILDYEAECEKKFKEKVNQHYQKNRPRKNPPRRAKKEI